MWFSRDLFSLMRMICAWNISALPPHPKLFRIGQSCLSCLWIRISSPPQPTLAGIVQRKWTNPLKLEGAKGEEFSAFHVAVPHGGGIFNPMASVPLELKQSAYW
ncbi:MAG: hypothetical protein KJS91_10030 [Planctomycetes bacterium]|nr:hypothetical protein [Planctomycetota bacterium]